MSCLHQNGSLKKSNHLIKTKLKGYTNLKQMARENIKLNDKELDKELATKMNNPYYLIDENLKVGITINLENHNIIHAKSVLSIFPNFPDIGTETRYINETLKEMATIYARLINQYKFKDHIFLSAIFYTINEEDQRSEEFELFSNLANNFNLTENNFDKIDIKSQLEHQIQIQETKESGWIFDKINSMKIRFYKTVELDGSSYVKFLLRSNALINFKKNDKYCFFGQY